MTESELRQLLKSLTWTLDVKRPKQEPGAVYYNAAKEHYRTIYLCTKAKLETMTADQITTKISKAVRKEHQEHL